MIGSRVLGGVAESPLTVWPHDENHRSMFACPSVREELHRFRNKHVLQSAEKRISDASTGRTVVWSSYRAVPDLNLRERQCEAVHSNGPHHGNFLNSLIHVVPYHSLEFRSKVPRRVNHGECCCICLSSLRKEAMHLQDFDHLDHIL